MKYKQYVEGKYASLEEFYEDMKSELERTDDFDNIIGNDFLNYKQFIINHPIHLKYLNDDTFSLEEFRKEIQNDIDKLGKQIINGISKQDIERINKTFLNFYHGTQKEIKITRNKLETKTYIKYLCEKYNFNCVSDDRNTLSICKPSTFFGDTLIYTLMQKYNQSKIRNNETVKRFSEIVQRHKKVTLT